MRALIQRVTQAHVAIGSEIVGRTGPGLLVLICAMQGDDVTAGARLAARIARLRIFRDDRDRMNRSVLDTGGSALVVSQFTLAADTRSGNRPGFSGAAAPDDGLRLYEAFVQSLRDQGVAVDDGRFGADMAVHLVNDGPVTIWMDSTDRA